MLVLVFVFETISEECPLMYSVYGRVTMLNALSAAVGISPAKLPSSLRHQTHQYDAACEVCRRDDERELLIKEGKGMESESIGGRKIDGKGK